MNNCTLNRTISISLTCVSPLLAADGTLDSRTVPNHAMRHGHTPDSSRHSIQPADPHDLDGCYSSWLTRIHHASPFPSPSPSPSPSHRPSNYLYLSRLLLLTASSLPTMQILVVDGQSTDAVEATPSPKPTATELWTDMTPAANSRNAR